MNGARKCRSAYVVSVSCFAPHRVHDLSVPARTVMCFCGGGAGAFSTSLSSSPRALPWFDLDVCRVVPGSPDTAHRNLKSWLTRPGIYSQPYIMLPGRFQRHLGIKQLCMRGYLSLHRGSPSFGFAFVCGAAM